MYDDHDGYKLIGIQRGWTPLHLAAQSGLFEVCRVLVAAGANVDALDKNGQTPLHVTAAALWGEVPDICRLLVAAGADVHARDHKNRTPLHRAAESWALDIYKLLRKAGADPHAKDSIGRKCLCLRVERCIGS